MFIKTKNNKNKQNKTNNRRPITIIIMSGDYLISKCHASKPLYYINVYIYICKCRLYGTQITYRKCCIKPKSKRERNKCPVTCLYRTLNIYDNICIYIYIIFCFVNSRNTANLNCDADEVRVTNVLSLHIHVTPIQNRCISIHKTCRSYNYASITADCVPRCVCVCVTFQH